MKKIKFGSIFNKGLYFEGLKQLRIIGILLTVLITVFAVAIPIESAAFAEAEKKVVIATEINPLMVLCFLIIAPLMTLKLFSFLNKRSSSDFYHSLPHKRECIFISYMASVLTWIAAIIAFTMGVSIIFTMLFPNLFAINFNTVPIYMLNTFATSFMVSAAVAIAMTVSGNLATNIMVSGLILFMPRIAMFVIRDAVVLTNPIISDKNFMPFLQNGYNVLTSTITLDTNTLLSWQGFTYTLILGLVYIALSLLLFKKRKSESAGQSAPNKYLQSVFRITLTMALCLGICWILVVDGGTDTAIILFALAVLLYFGYELITTRKWKNLLRIFPGLGIVALCNVILILFMTNIGDTVISNVPKPNEIEGVTLVVNKEYNNNFLSLYDYHMLDIGERPIKDEELIADLAESLATCVDVWKNTGLNEYDSYFRNAYHTEITVKFTLKDGSTIYRNIYVSGDIYDDFAEKTASIDITQHGSIITELPAYVPGTFEVYCRRHLSVEQEKEIFKMYNDEIKKISPQVWLDFIIEARNGYTDNSIATIEYQTIKGNESYSLVLPISDEVTPETAELLYKYMNENSVKDKDSFVMAIEYLKTKLAEGSIKEGDSLHAYISVDIYTKDGTIYGKSFSPECFYGKLNAITEDDFNFILDTMNDGISNTASADSHMVLCISYHETIGYSQNRVDVVLVLGAPDDIDPSLFYHQVEILK